MSAGFARGLVPPYFAVIFTSQRNQDDPGGYAGAAEAMMALAAQQPGFLGVESVRGEDGFGITVSYWESEAAIAHWRNDAEHTATRDRGRNRWYGHYEVRVARVERNYAGPPMVKT